MTQIFGLTDGSKVALTPVLSDIADDASYKKLTTARQTLIDSASQLVPATTYYVDATSGNDANDGLSAGAAFQHLQYALDKFNYKILSGDCKIRVIAGDYSAEGALNVLNVVGALQITAFDGTNDVSAVGDTYIIDSIYIYRCVHVTVHSLLVNSVAADGRFHASASNVWFYYCKTVSATAYGILFGLSQGECLGCLVSNKTSAVIRVSGASLVRSADWTAGSGNAIGINSSSSTVCKNGTQPQGTTAETTDGGGVIR